MSINAWGSDDPAEVAKGGTGNATLTDHGVLLGSGTGAVTVTSAPTNGQLLIGNTGSDPSVAAPTGDTNEIAVTTGAGSLAVGIADDCILPGTGSYTWVDGTTAQRPGTPANGMARYNTTTDMFEGYQGGAWTNFITQITPGTVVQQVYASNTSVVTCTTTIPYDDTIPQNTEGDEVVTATLTPLSATNRLYIFFDAVGGNAASITGGAALFQDSTANALYATAASYAPTSKFTMIYSQAAGTSSSTTFKVRCGPLGSGGTMYINGQQSTGTRLFGGISAATLTILEISV
jgi:hypothetical protein